MKRSWKRAVPALACCLLAAAALCLLYRFDNKYTARAALTQDGAVALSAGTVDRGALFPAVDGWQLWPDRLLAPGELETSGGPPVETYIGQALTLRPYHADGSPYGVATWRLRLTSDRPVTVSMLIPEAYCASAVWAGGAYLGGTGSVEPYTPLVADRLYSFSLDGPTEVVVQTANYSHYYSGLTFPPVMGSPGAVGQYMALRLVLYAFLCFSSLAVALFSAAVWLGRKGRRDSLHLWFGGLCLAFALRVCYPFVRAAGVPLVWPLYALEDLGAFALLYCAGRIVCRLGSWENRPWARYGLFPVSLAMCAAGALGPGLLLPALPAFSLVYGLLVSWYQLIMAVLLLALALRGASGKSAAPLCGLGVFAVTEFFSVVWNGPFEPLRGAWPEEYGGFVLVLCFAWLMVERSRSMAAENERLTDCLQEEVALKTASLTAMTQERARLLAGMLHDLKSPLSAIQNYAALIRENGVLLDEDTRDKLALIDGKCRDLGGRMKVIQTVNSSRPAALRPEPVDLVALLERFYRRNKPDVEVGDVDFLLRLPGERCILQADPAALEQVLENLVYNAVSFTPPGGRILLSLDTAEGRPVLRVSDTGAGIPADVLPHIFEPGFTTRAGDGGQGLGLAIVKSTVESAGGSVTAASTPGLGTEFVLRFPPFSG